MFSSYIQFDFEGYALSYFLHNWNRGISFQVMSSFMWVDIFQVELWLLIWVEKWITLINMLKAAPTLPGLKDFIKY